VLIVYARQAVEYVWILFLVVWFSAALTTKRRQKSAGSGLRLPLGLILLAAIVLFDRRIAGTWLALPLLPNSLWLVLPGTLFVCAGIALAFWARFHLGRNWGPPATMRVGHELVTSGAYAYLRHPIYVGMGVAVVGAALVYGNALVVLVAGLVILRFWWAARVENQLLIRQFGEQAERR